MSVGAYELVKVCDNGLEAEWFRVVVEVGTFGNLKSVVAVYVYFEEVFITVTSNQDTWVCFLDKIPHSYTLYFPFKAPINHLVKINYILYSVYSYKYT